MRAPSDRRWLVTGAGGMLGRDLVDVLRAAGADVTAAIRADLDVTDGDAVAAAVSGHDVVVNAAAWTDVDGAETSEDAALAVNGAAPGLLAAACRSTGARLVHVSTDYVFSGDATEPYAEDAPTGPRSAYGRTKLAGEHAVLGSGADAVVVRTAWVYGEHGPSFVAAMLRLAGERDTLQVVDDQRGQPTWSHDLAERLVAVAESDVTGVLHGTSEGETTWFGLACAVFQEAGLDPERVHPTTTQAFPRPAPRPAYSVLGHDRWAGAGLPAFPAWRDSLRAALPRIRSARGV